MKSRDHMLAAIRHEPADRISTDAIHIENQPEIARYLGIAPDEVLDRLGGPDHHIKPDVSPENTVALFDTATTFRRGGYTQ